MTPIQPQYLNLASLLSGRLFVIPEYQRAYSWTSRQREDLFGDIEKIQAKGPDDGHFMAAIVCLRQAKQILGTDEFYKLEVVDGQQRLTTLILLLQVIKLELDSRNTKEARAQSDLAELLVKPEGDELLLLQTNHDTSHHFDKFLRQGSAKAAEDATTLADKELLRAIEECQSFVAKWKRAGKTLLELVALLKNRIFFLLHEISDERSVYTVFEVLNSRGLDVSWMDRLKSILMGAAFEMKGVDRDSLIKDLHATWAEIYRVVGLRQGLNTEALRFAATLLASEMPSRRLSEQDATEILRAAAGSAKGIREVASWLLDVTKACDEVAKNPRINAVTDISQARLLATAIHLKKDLKAGERRALLTQWEKVSFRIYGMMRKDTRYCVGDYVRLSWRITNEKLSASEIHAQISAIGSEYTIAMAVDALKGANCYEGWENELRYLMFRYEEHLAREQGLNFSNEGWKKIWMESPSRSIEHIWAQSKAPDTHRHRLGNLMLLPPGLNSKLKDKAAKLKAADYRKTGLLVAGEVADTVQSQGWNAASIKEREGALLAWAKKEWAD